MTSSEYQAAMPPFRPGCPSSGVLLHVTSLPSPYGIGDVGPSRLRMGGPAPQCRPEVVAGAAFGTHWVRQLALLSLVLSCG